MPLRGTARSARAALLSLADRVVRVALLPLAGGEALLAPLALCGSGMSNESAVGEWNEQRAGGTRLWLAPGW